MKMISVTYDSMAIRYVLRYLSRKTIEDLWSTNSWRRGVAKGMLYEALLYELAREGTLHPSVKTVVRKFSDVPKTLRTQALLGQNGLFYDNDGRIVARGNGTDLGEFDLLFLDRENHVNFAEIKSSGNNLMDFDREIAYKRKILDYHFCQSHTHCLVFCPSNVSCHLSHVVSSDPYMTLVETQEMDLKVLQKSSQPLEPSNTNESICLTELSQRTFHYNRIHDELREGIIAGYPLQSIETSEPASLVNRILLGSACESDLIWLLNFKQLSVEGKRLDPQNFFKNFQTITVSLSLLHRRPILFLRGRWEEVYLKMGPKSVSEFEFERNIWPHRTVLFDWLENVNQHCISRDCIQSVFERWLREEDVGLRKKYGEHPFRSRR